LIVGIGDDEDLVGGERTEASFDGFERVGATHASLDVIGWGWLLPF